MLMFHIFKINEVKSTSINLKILIQKKRYSHQVNSYRNKIRSSLHDIFYQHVCHVSLWTGLGLTFTKNIKTCFSQITRFFFSISMLKINLCLNNDLLLVRLETTISTIQLLLQTFQAGTENSKNKIGLCCPQLHREQSCYFLCIHQVT